MVYLYGKVVYLPRKFYDTKGKKRLGKVLILEEEHNGKIVNFDIKNPPPSVAVSRNSIVRLHCEWKDENTIVIPDITGIIPKISSSAVVILMKHSLPDIDSEALIRACGVDKLSDVFDLYQADSIKFKELISGHLESNQAEAVVNFFLGCLRNHDFNMLCNLLAEAEPGLDMHDVLSIYDLFEHRAVKRKMIVTEMVRREPWIIAQAEDISFRQADEVASFLGFEGFPVGRIAGAIMSVLWEGARSGNTYMPKGTVINRAKMKLRNKYTNDDDIYRAVKDVLNRESLREHFRGMWIQDLNFANEEVVSDLKRYYRKMGKNPSDMKLEHKGRGIYLCGPFRSESYGAERFVEIVQSTPEININSDEFLAKALKKYPYLDGGQKKALQSIAENAVTLLTGSAGTGKTEVIAAAVAAMRDYGDIRLMAPTGIAAQRLSERTGLNASTIHVGAGIFKDMEDLADPAEENGSSREEVSPDLTVIDEISMCDIISFNKVLSKVPLGSRLLLVGDPAQLNSPGPGDVIGDLVKLANSPNKPGGFNLVNLDKIHRSTAVIKNANKIRKGESPEYKPGFEMIKADNDQIELLDQLLDELIAGGTPFKDVLVLSSRKGESVSTPGVEQLNRYLQKKFNPGGREIKGTAFRIGDPVICIENDYKRNKRFNRTESRRDVFNGEKGVIVSVDDKDNLSVEFKDGKQSYTVNEASRWLRLAYALTIHKSQGGESPVVIIVDWDSKRFTRSMLYTAVTRAKHVEGKPYSERVYFIGPEGFIESAVRNRDELRYSKLFYRILDNLGVYVSGNKTERVRKRMTVKVVAPEVAPEEHPAMVAKPPEH